MPIPQEISDALLADAEGADPATARALTKAANKLASYTSQPQDRKQAARITSVIDPAVVGPIGAHLRTNLSHYDSGHFVSHYDPWHYVSSTQNSYAISLLLLATLDATTRADAIAALDGLAEQLRVLPGPQVEYVHFTLGHFEDIPIAATLRDQAEARLRAEPVSPAGAWAERLGLGLPFGRWRLEITLPGAITPGLAGGPRPGDLDLISQISHRPSSADRWVLRFGAGQHNVLGNDGAHPAGGQLVRYRRSSVFTGEVVSPRAIGEIPAVVTALCAAHPDLRFGAARVTSYPRRGLVDKAGVELVRGWLADG